MRQDVYQRITDQIVTELEKGVRPWKQPWSAEHAAGRIVRPRRFNGLLYNGINVLMLWSAAMEKGYSAYMDDLQTSARIRGACAQGRAINRMACVKRVADLALGLEAADARSLAGAGINYHDGALARVGRHARRGHDARERIVHGPWQRQATRQHFMIEAEHGRHRPRRDLDLLIAALPQQIDEEDAALELSTI